MSQETSQWLNQNILIGFTEKRGKAWWYRKSDEGTEPNHYVGAVPYEDVRRRLFDWEPVESPIQFVVNGQTYVDPTRKGIVRPDTHDLLGVFSPKYVPHGYSQWLVTEVENILDRSRGDLQIGSAGLLRKGGVGWVQFEMEETAEVAGVQFRPFLTAATSFDGSLATTYTTGGQLVVCDNTLASALRNPEAQAKIKHTVHSLSNIQQVRDHLGLVIATTEDLMAEIYELANESVSDKVWRAFLDSVAAPADKDASKRATTLATNKREAIEALWNSDPRVAPWKGTAYGVVAAMNTYSQHVQGVRNMSRPERNMLDMVEGKFEKDDAKTMETLREVQARYALTA